MNSILLIYFYLVYYFLSLGFIILLLRSLPIIFLHLIHFFFTRFSQFLNSKSRLFCCLIISCLFTGFRIQIYCLRYFINYKQYPKNYKINWLISNHFDKWICKDLFFSCLIHISELLLVLLGIILCSLLLCPFYFTILNQLSWYSIETHIIIIFLNLRCHQRAKV